MPSKSLCLAASFLVLAASQAPGTFWLGSAPRGGSAPTRGNGCDAQAPGCTAPADRTATGPGPQAATVNGPLVWLDGNPGPQDMTHAAGGLGNGVIIASGGNRVSYCPTMSCVTSPDADHQRASALFWSTTSDDGHSQEQTVAIQTTVGTGHARSWSPDTAFAAGDNIQFPGANTVYRAIVPGVSAGSGTGPTGKAADIVDGSVHWKWINDQRINAKLGLYIETVVVPGAGASWGQANNVHLRPGVVPSFNMGLELDFLNDAAECIPGKANCNNLELAIGGAYRSTQGLHLTSPNAGPTHATRWGIRLDSAFLASDADIEVDSSAAVGLGFNSSGLGGQHGTADIQSLTTSPTAINVGGSHAAQAYSDTSTSPAALSLAGKYALAAIYTGGATTPTALGTGDNQKICFNGIDACFVHSATLGKLYYQVGGMSVFSLSDRGDAVFKGTVTQNGVP